MRTLKEAGDISYNVSEHHCKDLEQRKPSQAEMNESIVIESMDGNHFITITKYSDLDMVEDGVSDHAGEIWSVTSTVITYCPFCGMKLTQRE